MRRLIRWVLLGVFASIMLACMPTYEQKTACEKESIIWDNIQATEYETLPLWTGAETTPLLLRVLLDPFNIIGLSRQYLSVTMDNESDEVPMLLGQPARTRVIHPYGSVATIEFLASKMQPFSGLFKGVPCGVMRLSLAAQPSETRSTPGAGIKWLIDGQASANFVAMNALGGQEGYNFFEKSFSNFIAAPEDGSGFLSFGFNLFALVTEDPTKVDVSFMAEVDTMGNAVPVGDVDMPYQLILTPNINLNFDQTPHEFRDDLASIPVGTVLYTVYGIRKGETQQYYIGAIRNKTPFIASAYGDQDLFFRHDRIDDRL